jgi:hypothetical protein
MLFLFVAYCIVSYLFILGIILGEITVKIKPSMFHLAFFVLAPLTAPLAIGYMCVHLMNPGAARIDQADQASLEEFKVKVNVKP